jgi:hypothetical protein
MMEVKMEKVIFQEEIFSPIYLSKSIFAAEKKINIFELIKYEHGIISDLLKKFETINNLQSKKAIFKALKSCLILHFYLEEKTFFSTLVLMKPTHRIIEKFIFENEKIFSIVNELEGFVFNQNWEINYRLLKEYINNHIIQEECTLFSLAGNILNKQQIDDLGRIARYEKRRMGNLI